MLKCKYCKKESTRNYRHEELCELHYLQKSNNKVGVIIRMRDNPPWRIVDRIALLTELRKHYSEKELEDDLGRESWYIRLKKVNKNE